MVMCLCWQYCEFPLSIFNIMLRLYTWCEFHLIFGSRRPLLESGLLSCRVTWGNSEGIGRNGRNGCEWLTCFDHPGPSTSLENDCDEDCVRKRSKNSLWSHVLKGDQKSWWLCYIDRHCGSDVGTVYGHTCHCMTIYCISCCCIDRHCGCSWMHSYWQLLGLKLNKPALYQCYLTKNYI